MPYAARSSTLLAAALLAATSANAQLSLYDDFSASELDPDRWRSEFACTQATTLECARELRGGSLRVRIRGYGVEGSDSGSQFDGVRLAFTQPEEITSIAATMVVDGGTAEDCPANESITQANLLLGGVFFNAGDGAPQDDRQALLLLQQNDLQLPGQVTAVALINSPFNGDVFASQNITELTAGETVFAQLQWDAPANRFVFLVRPIGGIPSVVSLPYSDSDDTAPAQVSRYVSAEILPQSCTSPRVFGEVSGRFLNVFTDAPLGN